LVAGHLVRLAVALNPCVKRIQAEVKHEHEAALRMRGV
jgi:hypothetical protein